jgi:hypothetical protein
MDRLSSGKNQPWASRFSAADYDTNQDPIVRASAAEIRKRIAQYYHEPGHETELRIELPLGSYVPVFHLAAAAQLLTPAAGPARTLAKKWRVP